MFTNTASTRLLSAGVLDQEQLEDSERLRRLGEKENSLRPPGAGLGEVSF